jgi:anthranilate phosphoribosyltransferase
VHGADGLDEISTTGYTKVSEARAGVVRTFYVHPADFGLPKSAPADLRGGDAATNATIAREVLNGGRGPTRDVVLLNAGAALLVAGVTPTMGEGLRRAAHALDSGAAAARLERMIDTTRAVEESPA